MKNKCRKRICILMPGHWSSLMGGSQYQAKCIIEELAKTKRYEIYFLTRDCQPNYLAKGYRLLRYQFPGYHFQGVHRHFFDFMLLPKMLKSINPDIIYQRVGCALTGIAANYAVKNKKTMVWHVAHENDIEPSRIKFSRLSLYRIFDRHLLNYGIRNSTHVITQTEDQKRILEKNFQRLPSAVIPNFHPMPREILLKKDPVKVVWVANLKPSKQPEIFMRLASELRDLPNTMFIMVGSIHKSSPLRQKYLQLLSKTPSLFYLGARTQEEVNQLLARSHIFVNTSVREGFPNTFIQAWMRQVPVISLNVDPDSLIKLYNLGLYSGTFERLKKDVSLMIEKSELRSRIGTQAQEFAFKYFSTKNAEQIINIFETE